MSDDITIKKMSINLDCKVETNIEEIIKQVIVSIEEDHVIISKKKYQEIMGGLKTIVDLTAPK